MQSALADLPSQYADALSNVIFRVERAVLPRDRRRLSLGNTTLYGLYEGVPLTQRDASYDRVLPDRITLYQGPIEDASESDDDVVVCIGETLIHELGHYFGLSEDEIEEIEERYWRGDAEAD